MIKSSKFSNLRLSILGVFVVLLLGCNNAEQVAEPTPRPVVAATADVPPTPTPEPTNTPEPVDPTAIPEPTEVPDPTIDPENDGTQLKVPVMQENPFVIEFEEVDGLLVDKGIGPIAPASSINFTFMGFPGQTFNAQVDGGTFGNALLFNGAVVPITLMQGRASVWELTQGGEYTYSISNGGAGANYTYEFSLTMADGSAAATTPQRFQFGQGVNEKLLTGETTGSDPVVYIFDAFEGQKLSLSLSSDSSKVLFINVESGEIFESAVGTTTLEIPPLANNGEYRIEVTSDAAESFELSVALLP